VQREVVDPSVKTHKIILDKVRNHERRQGKRNKSVEGTTTIHELVQRANS
jgi:hypothetical protein